MRTEKDTLVEQLREAVRGRERGKSAGTSEEGSAGRADEGAAAGDLQSLDDARNMEIIHYLAKQEEKFPPRCCVDGF